MQKKNVKKRGVEITTTTITTIVTNPDGTKTTKTTTKRTEKSISTSSKIASKSTKKSNITSSPSQPLVSKTKVTKPAVQKSPTSKPSTNPRSTIPSVSKQTISIHENTVSEIEHMVWAYHNLIRTHPQKFIPVLEELLPFYVGNSLKIPGQRELVTKEGKSAILEAIEALKQQQPVGFLEYSVGLSLAARDHLNDHGPKGLIGHEGTDGSHSKDRILRYIKSPKFYGENCR